MADTSLLLQALMSGQEKAAENPFGIASQALAANSPYLINQYGSAGQNFGTVVGASLLAALLAGIAKNQTTAANAEFLPVQREFVSATPDRQKELLAGEYGTKLTPISQYLTLNGMERANNVADKVAEQRALAGGKLAEAIQTKRAETVLSELASRGLTLDDKGNTVPITGMSSGAGNALKPKELADAEIALSQKIAGSNEAKQFGDVSANWEAMMANAPKKTQAASVSMITSAAKILDPGAVVRESDFTIIANPGSPAAMLQSYLDKIKGEGQLTPAMKRDLLDSMSTYVQARHSAYQKMADSMMFTGKAQGMEPNHFQLMQLPSLDIPTLETAPALDMTTFIADAKARGLTKEQAKVEWGKLGGG